MQNDAGPRAPARTDGISAKQVHGPGPTRTMTAGAEGPGGASREWDYYLVTPRCALGHQFPTMAIWLDSLSLIDLKPCPAHRVQDELDAPGQRGLPASSLAELTRAVGKNYEFTFRVEEGQRSCTATCMTLRAEDPCCLHCVAGAAPGSMVIVTPFHKKPRQFYYNRKIGPPAEAG